MALLVVLVVALVLFLFKFRPFVPEIGMSVKGWIVLDVHGDMVALYKKSQVAYVPRQLLKRSGWKGMPK